MLTPAERAKIRRRNRREPLLSETNIALALVYGIAIPGLLAILAIPFFH